MFIRVLRIRWFYRKLSIGKFKRAWHCGKCTIKLKKATFILKVTWWTLTLLSLDCLIWKMEKTFRVLVQDSTCQVPARSAENTFGVQFFFLIFTKGKTKNKKCPCLWRDLKTIPKTETSKLAGLKCIRANFYDIGILFQNTNPEFRFFLCPAGSWLRA